MMLKVIQQPHFVGERVIALGSFDGVHRGHESLLSSAAHMHIQQTSPGGADTGQTAGDAFFHP